MIRGFRDNVAVLTWNLNREEFLREGQGGASWAKVRTDTKDKGNE